MIRNYLKTAWRNILKNRTFSIINVFGLAVSMSVCMLIILIVADYKDYDQFHQQKKRIFRVQTFGKGAQQMQTASSPLQLSQKLRQEYPDIEQAVTLSRGIGGDLLYNEEIVTGAGYFSDGSIFRVFDFALQEGDPGSALRNPFTMVISADLAARLFGRERAVGKTIKFNDKGIIAGVPDKGNRETPYGLFTITGVLKPNPGKTHLPFDLLASQSSLQALSQANVLQRPADDWDNVWNSYTYVLLHEGKSPKHLQQILDEVSDRIYSKSSPNQFGFKSVALTDIALSDPIGNMTSMTLPRVIIWILAVLCLIVMLSACLNYTNLSVARSITRAREVGVRRVMGARSRQIFFQFIAEAVLISMFALVVSFGFLELLKYGFTHLWLNKFLDLSFDAGIRTYVVFLIFSILVGVSAGFLPAFYISRFNPSESMKSLKSLRVLRGLTLRKALLVAQFCVSLVFIISTVMIYRQTSHILNFDYGFNKENVVNVRLYNPDNFQRYAAEISKSPQVMAVSACAFPPSTGTMNSTMAYALDRSDSTQMSYIDIDAKCLDVWELGLHSGQNLPEFPATQGETTVLLNETAVRELGYPSAAAAAGQQVLIDGNAVRIAGVVNDFQFADVTRPITSLALRNRQSQFGYATIRISGKDNAAALEFLQKTWKKVNPQTAFEYEYFDDQVLFTHSILENGASVLGVLSLLAIFISCLGLFGMSNYTAETRMKEIGIRKVLGSDVSNIVLLLSRGFGFQLVLAILIATPIAYLLNNLWLNFFPSRVSIGVLTIGGSVLVMVFISAIIVLSQALRAAVANPVRSLRAE